MAPTIDQHIDPIVFRCRATWAHHAIAHEGNRKDMINGLAIAVALGLILQCSRRMNISTRPLVSLETSMARTSLWRLVSTVPRDRWHHLLVHLYATCDARSL